MPQVAVSSSEFEKLSADDARPRRSGTGAPIPPPLRRRRGQRPAPAPSPVRRRLLNYMLALVTVVLVVNALVGDKGLLETTRARRQYADVAASLTAMRQQNARLRDEVRRLKEDPATIEAIARQELGLLRPGEVLFVVKDADKAR